MRRPPPGPDAGSRRLRNGAGTGVAQGHGRHPRPVMEGCRPDDGNPVQAEPPRSEEHTSELQSLMRISYAVLCLKKKTKHISYAALQFTKKPRNKLEQHTK